MTDDNTISLECISKKFYVILRRRKNSLMGGRGKTHGAFGP